MAFLLENVASIAVIFGEFYCNKPKHSHSTMETELENNGNCCLHFRRKIALAHVIIF
jgi:hypothetical protein